MHGGFGPAGWLKITIRIARIVVIISKCIPMVQEVFDVFHRDGKAKAFDEVNFHIGHAHHFTAQIKQRTATIAGIDLRRGLQVKVALQSCLGH